MSRQAIERKMNLDIMQQILDSFVILTDIRVAFFGEDLELVNGKQKAICPFCSVIKAIPALASGCEQSDRQAFGQAKATRSLVLYRCHMGLWEAVTPVYVRDILAGYLMFGQVRNDPAAVNEEQAWAGIQRRLTQHRIDPDQIVRLERAFALMPSVSDEKLQAAARMLQLMTQAIMSANIIQIRESEAIAKTRQYLQENFCRPVSLQAIAAYAGLNPTYLSNLFRRKTGRTISQELVHLKIARAEDLLASGNLSVKQIALACGFHDQNYFSRFFRKQQGVSPQTYRQRLS